MSDAEPILSVRDVSKAFGAVQALNGVSFDVHPGEVVALAGDNGAGKSTIIKAISGVFRHDSGEILLGGKPIAFATPHEARENGIETIYQDLALADNLSIGENIFLGREPKRKLFGFLPILDRTRMAGAAQEAMARLDFHVTRLDAPVAAFSGGQRQAIAIGRAIYWNARLVIMDEPTAALGVPEQRRVLALIKSLRTPREGDYLHLAQPARHFRGRRRDRRFSPWREGRRAQAFGDDARRDREANGRQLDG